MHGCPFAADAAASLGSSHVRFALQKCPFLASVGGSAEEEVSIGDFEAAFNHFHSFKGVVPLARLESVAPPTGCPYSNRGLRLQKREGPATEVAGEQGQTCGQLALAAPFAAASFSLLGFLPNAHSFFAKLRQQQIDGKRQGPGSSNASKGSGGGGAPRGSTPQGRGGGPPRAAGGTGTTARTGVGNPPRARPLRASTSSASKGGGKEGKCPLRDWPLVGGLIPLSVKGDLACPPVIMAARAAVARLKPVRDLRPQALPVKMLAIGAAGMLANIPFGMWREHLEKFSPGWFVAVHATIPGIALLRKGVVMPKWAIILTIATAAAGQILGGKVERRRLTYIEQERRARLDTTCRQAPLLKALIAHPPAVQVV